MSKIQNNGLDIQKRCAEGAIDIANRLGLPLVATCDAHYLRQEDNLPHDILLCINTGRPSRTRTACATGSDSSTQAAAEMYKNFPGQEMRQAQPGNCRCVDLSSISSPALSSLHAAGQEETEHTCAIM